MTTRPFSRLALAALLLAAGASHAQLFRAYLASDGNDANACTLGAPCRLLPAALAAVADGGEIWMLDSANFNTGTVTIGKSVSILAVPGAVGSLVALNGGPAVSVTAAGLKIALRNIVIGPVAGATAGTHGVHVTGASSLTIEQSLIANIPQHGALVTGSGSVRVIDTTLRDIGGSAVLAQQGARAAIVSSRLLNTSGVQARSPTTATTAVTVSDSVISANGGGRAAFAKVEADNATARVSVVRTTIDRQLVGLSSEVSSGIGNRNALVYAARSLIVDNTYAWAMDAFGARVLSNGTNQFSGNSGQTGTLTGF